MKKGHFLLLIAAIGSFLFVYNYHFQGLLTTAQAIFCFIIFTSLATLLIGVLSLLAKNLASALKERLKEHTPPPYLQEMPIKKRAKNRVVVLDNPWYTRIGILLRRRPGV